MKRVKNRKLIGLLVASVLTMGLGVLCYGVGEVQAKAETSTPPTASAIDLLGASIRYIPEEESPNTGSIRYGMSVSAENYANFTADLNVGLLIIPQNKLEGELTFDTAEVGVATVFGGTDKKVNAFKKQKDGTYEAYVYVWNIGSTAWDNNIAIRGYIKNGEDRSYSTETLVRSVREVASLAYNDPETSAVNQEKLETYLNGTEYTVSFGENTESYEFGTDFTVPQQVPTKEHYNFVGWCLEGSEELYDFTADKAKFVSKNMTFTPKFIQKGFMEAETFTKGEVIAEEKYYQGPVVNVGSRADGSTLNEATVTENGFRWNAWTLGNARVMFRYNNYENLSAGKQYVARVAVTTTENYPDAGYIMVYGFKTEACDSYKIANAGTDAIITTEEGSTARKIVAGKNKATYFDFVMDGTKSSEFFIAYHSASNTDKVGMTAELFIKEIQIIDMSEYEELGVLETFEEESVSVNGLSYTGENFDITAAAGDTMSVQNHPAPQLSMHTSGKALYWVSPRVWKKGLTTNDEGTAVTHNAKIIFTYKGEFDANGSYRIRIPLYMKANTEDQVKTTSVETYYGTAGTYSEKLLDTKTIGWTRTLTMIEVIIPANSNWNRQLVMRMYNSAITANNAGSKMLCYFDGLSVEML